MEYTALLSQFENDIRTMKGNGRGPRAVALHSPSRKMLIHRPDLIPIIDQRLTELSESDKTDDIRSYEGLKTLREWILVHCGILHESGRRRSTPVPSIPYEPPTIPCEPPIIDDLENMSFSGTPQRAAAIYRMIAVKGISPKEKFVLRRYLDLPIPDTLEHYAAMPDEEYFLCLANVAKQLPKDAR